MAAVTLKPAGLYTYFQNLTEVPPGALLKASNVIIQRNGVVESRRGFGYYGSTFGSAGSRAKQLMTYKERIIRHYGTELAYDNGSGTFTAFSGSYTEPESGIRIKSVEAYSNFYFTTDSGIKKISAQSASDFTNSSGFIKSCGGPKAIDGIATIDYATVGFLPALNNVAYRIVWGYTDNNGLLILGSPSYRINAYNQSSINNTSVKLTFTIPNDVLNTSYFFRVYRSEYSTGTTSDELNLVFQGNPTSAELSAKQIIFTDSLPESLRPGGTPLYTNKFSGEGILNSNEQPPWAKDIALFKNHLLYANTRLKHRKNINLLAVSGFVSGTSDLIITDGTTTTTYTFQGQAEVSRVVCTAFAAITDNSYFILNSASNERIYFVWFDKINDNIAPSNSETLGKIPIRVNINGLVTDAQVAAALQAAINSTASADFSASLSTNQVDITNSKNGSSTNIVDGTTIPTGFTFSTLTQGLGQDTSTQKILLSSNASPTQAVDETARSIVATINAQSSEIVSAYYLSSSDDTPGQILLERRDLTDTIFYVATTDSAIVNKFTPEVGMKFTNSTVSLANPTLITTSSNHGLNVNDNVFIYGATTTSSINGLQKATTTPALNTYNININVSSASVNGNTIVAKNYSSAEKSQNRIYYSKTSEIEAVPTLNYFDVGSKDQAIERIVALRESVFILKTDGIFRLVGDAPSNFTVLPYDLTFKIACPDSAVSLDNQLYVFSDEGIIRINETSSDIISHPIEDKLIPLTVTNGYIRTATFAVAYETEKTYVLCTVKTSSDSYATTCYVYNFLTDSWCEWDISKTCGVIQENKLYFGSAIANTLEKERKSYNRFDFYDRELTTSLSTNAYSGTTIKPGSFSSIRKGDVLAQAQYLTIYQYNALLLKLDIDSGLTGVSFYDTLAISNGVSLSNAMTALVAELNIQDTDSFADTNGNTSYVFSGTTVWATIQTEFNKIIDRLNQSPTTSLSNYVYSTGTTRHEAIVIDVDNINLNFTINIAAPFIQGELLIYKSIYTEVEFVPQHAGDPVSWKQFSMGTLMFKRRSFYSATASYASDVNPNYEDIDFTPGSYGLWGNFVWGEGAVWGGDGDSAPLRCYVPMQKQRCRMISCKFKHVNALESFSFYGLSLTVRAYSENAYK